MKNVGPTLGIALLVTTGNWVVVHFLESPVQVQAALSDAKTAIAVLKESDNSQNETIAEMKGNIEYIRRSIEEQNRRQGITIGPLTTTQ